jgi:hypothetical protein
MPATVFRCPNCGAELWCDPRKTGTPSRGRPGCPYDGLAYASLRAEHDAIYFGPWRKIEASPYDVRRGYQQIGRHIHTVGDALAGQDLPAARRDLALAVEAYNGADPSDPSGDLHRFLDNALSYAHQVIDDLLHEKGLPPHHPMDFSEWYDVVEVPFRDEW